MKGSEVLEKIMSGNKRFVLGERTGVCNPRAPSQLFKAARTPESHQNMSWIRRSVRFLW